MANDKDDDREVSSLSEATDIFVNEYAEKISDPETWKTGLYNATARILGEEVADAKKK